MSDVNPWARLGSRPVHEEELTLVPSNDVILLRDQFLQLSKIVMLLSSRVDELEKGANAIESLTSSLSRISLLKFDGSKINMTAFAKDLAQSVPAIETAIMGGTLNKGFMNLKRNIDIKGLASADIDFTTAISNIRALRSALGVELVPVGGGSTQQLQNATSTMMTSNGPVTVINAPDNSIKSSSSGVNIIELEAVPGFNAAQDEFNALRNAQ